MKKELEKNSALRVASYYRVSTQEQALKKTSIPQQKKDCHKLIEEKGWIFFNDYQDEGISGHLMEERHGLQSMLRDARDHKFDLIVVKDYDRFARNRDAISIVRQELKELGIQTYSINTPVEPKLVCDYDPDDNDTATIMETISDMRSDLERTAISRRMKMGKMIKAKAGKIPNKVPYGYVVVRTLDENKTKIIRNIIVDEAQAEKIRFIFNEYAKGLGIRKIVIQMNKNGWRGPKGLHWTSQTVKYILANPTYTGKVWWGWRHADYKKSKEMKRRGKVGYTGQGEHSPIIDENLFNLVQEIRAGRVTHAKGGTGRSLGMLTGIAKCIRCKCGVGYQKRYNKRSKINPNWKDTITHEYICTGYKYKGICSQRVMSAEKLESSVLDQIKNVYSNPKIQESITYDEHTSEEKDLDKKIARLEREIESGAAKEQRHKEAYEKELETLEELEINITRIRQEVEKSRVEVSHYLQQSSRTTQKGANIRKLVASFKDFDTCWNLMELDERKMILRSIIKEIRAGDGRVEIDFIF